MGGDNIAHLQAARDRYWAGRKERRIRSKTDYYDVAHKVQVGKMTDRAIMSDMHCGKSLVHRVKRALKKHSMALNCVRSQILLGAVMLKAFQTPVSPAPATEARGRPRTARTPNTVKHIEDRLLNGDDDAWIPTSRALHDEFLNEAKGVKRKRSPSAVPSTRTIRRAAREDLGFKSMRRRVRPKLNDEARQNRLHFAKRVLKDGVQWDKVLFSDEKIFEIGQHQVYCYQRGDKPRLLQRAKRPASIMVWGAVGLPLASKIAFVPELGRSLQAKLVPSWKKAKAQVQKRRTNLRKDLKKKGVSAEQIRKLVKEIKLPTKPKRMDTMNGELYRHCLQQALKPKATGIDYIFQQDGATCHTSAESLEFIEQAAFIPDVLPYWPASSPDLSPIENIWGLMVNDLNKEPASTLTELEAGITKSWRKHVGNRQLLESLFSCKAMRDRCKAVLDADGGHIPY
eukprot:gene23474-183_t